MPLLALPRNTNGDGAVRYEAIGSLLSGDLPREEYSLVTPLLALPPDLLGRLFGAEAAFAYRFNGIVFAIGLAAIWLILRHDVPGSLIRSFLLVLTFGSMFPALGRFALRRDDNGDLAGSGLARDRCRAHLGWSQHRLGRRRLGGCQHAGDLRHSPSSCSCSPSRRSPGRCLQSVWRSPCRSSTCASIQVSSPPRTSTTMAWPP